MAKIAVVTGASGGIGSACAKKLAKEGYTVIVHYFRHKDEAEHIARERAERIAADILLLKPDTLNISGARLFFLI